MLITTASAHEFKIGEVVCLPKHNCLQVKIKWVFKGYLIAFPLEWYEAVLFNIGRLMWGVD